MAGFSRALPGAILLILIDARPSFLKSLESFYEKMPCPLFGRFDCVQRGGS